jgi:hypothetical protein
VLIDFAAGEVVRLTARAGSVKWRRAIAGTLVATPLVMGQQIVVAARDGRVIALDAQTGQTKAAVQLAAAIRTAPVAAGGRILVAADRHDLFALHANDLSPKTAIALGHDSGSISCQPAALAPLCAIAENRGASSAVLLVASDSAVVQELPLPGCVVATAVRFGPRLVVPTDRGSLAFFEVTPDAKAPLKPTGESPAVGPACYVGEHSGKLLVAGAGLSCCDLVAKGKTIEIKPLWEAFAGSVCLAPPQVNREMIFCVRREIGSPTAIASAVRANNGQPVWETRLALPEAAP